MICPVALLSVVVTVVASQGKTDLKTTLAADPETFIAGVTPNLTLKCSPGETTSDLSNIAVFQLSREGVLLATGKPDGVVLSDDLRTTKYSSVDQMDINNLNNSYLLFHIQFPEGEDQGQYRCDMTYEDKSGFIQNAHSTLTLYQNASDEINVQKKLDQVNHQVQNLMTRLGRLETQVFVMDALNRNQSKMIAQLEAKASHHIGFFATLLDKPTGHLINEQDVVIFDQVLFNNGNGYNDTSGVFVAPQSGFYALSLVIEVQFTSGVRLEILLQVNDSTVSKLYITGDGPERGAQQSGSLVQDLQQGSRVKVVVGNIQADGSAVTLAGGNLCYLSGYYLG